MDDMTLAPTARPDLRVSATSRADTREH